MGVGGIATWGLIGGLAVAGAVSAVALVQGSWTSWHERILATAALVVAVAVQRAIAAAFIERRVLVRGSWTGVVCAFIAGAIWIAIIWVPYSAWSGLPGGWGDFGTHDIVMRTGGMLTIGAIFLLHAGAMLSLRILRTRTRAVRALTIGLAAIGGAGFVFIIWFGDAIPDSAGRQIVRAMAAVLVLGATGTAATPLLARLDNAARKDVEETQVNVQRASARVECPRCGASTTLRAGADGACASCGLKMRIELEEPRCACGYLLYGLKDGMCPECGAEAT